VVSSNELRATSKTTIEIILRSIVVFMHPDILPLGCGAAGAPAGCWEDEVGNKATTTRARKGNVMRLGIVLTC